MNSITAREHTALAKVVVQKWRDGMGDVQADKVAEEVPIALEYNGISHAVMLASPVNLDDFALGFSLSEGILAHPSELFDCDVSTVENGIQVQMRISSERFALLKARRRNLTGRTGCGLCGVETLQQAIRHPAWVESKARFSAASIYAGLDAMQMKQDMQHHTGATHAAAWLTAEGRIEVVREDVGRHNALDKLIGALAKERIDFSSGAALITSRASYEMVQKVATLGIGFLAAISAPTGLAIRLAEETNVTLLGFVRQKSHVVYAHHNRLIQDSKYYE
jgi:FdhD protein